MPRRAAIPVLLLLAIVAILPARGQPAPSAISLLAGLQSLAIRESQVLPDPFPIRRVLLPENAPLPVAPEGNPFRKMPRADFERLVRDAARNAPTKPNLVRANYRARFANDSLVGTGEWVVSSLSDSALSLDSLTVAVRDAKWPDGRDALLFGTPAKLWVDRRERTPVAFAWSARGTEEPGAVRFDLGLPPSPVAILELDLPTDRVPVLKGSQLLTGPLPQAGNRATWRIAFAGDAKLEFAIRTPTGAGLPPYATYARTVKFDLQPGFAVGTFEFETIATRGPLSTLEFDLDPLLTVTETTAPGLENWQRNANRLTLTFREPLTNGKVTLATVTIVPANGEPWTPPLIRPAMGSLSDDRLEVRVASEVKLEGWSPSDYRLIRTSTLDRSLLLHFRASLAAEGTPARRPPTLNVRTTLAEFSTVETLDWRIDPQRSRLTGQFRATVSRGPLTRLTFKIPPPFVPIAAVLTPDDPTAAWSSLGNGLWALEPTQPILTNDVVDVRVELRGPVPKFDKPDARLSWPLPLLSPVGAAKREGTFAVQLAPSLRGWLSNPQAEDSLSVKYSQEFDATLTLAAKRTAANEAENPPLAKPITAEGAWRFGELTSHCQFENEGEPRVHLSGRVMAAASRVLPIVLPSGATLDHATVDGKWANASFHDGTISLPLPTPDADGVTFTVSYRLPPSLTWPPRFTHPSAELPGSPPVRTSVQFGSRHRLWPTLADATDAPPTDAILVPVWLLHALSFGLVALLVAFVVGRFVRGHAGKSARLFLFLTATALGTATWWTPEGWRVVLTTPLVAALVGVVLLTLLAKPSVPRAASAIVVALFVTLPTTAQAPEAATIYFLQESQANPNTLTALVPQVVLDRLAVLATPLLPPVVLTNAEYVGSEANGTARFDATWQFHVTRDGPQLLALPLSGMRLEAMTLDGATAYPDASRANQYAVAVTGKGRHELKATFVVPVGGTGGDREVRFGVPDLLASRVTFALKDRQPTVSERTGSQTLTDDKSVTSVQADVGRGNAVAIRWREGATNTPSAATVLEATLWDVNETRAEALSAFVYQTNRGVLSRLTFDIPPGLEQGQVTIRNLDPAKAEAANGLRNWTLTPAANGAQQLAIELQNPAEGTLVVTFRLVPKDGLLARPALRMPRATNADVTASYLGVRLVGVTADAWQNENLIDFPADTVGRDFASVPELDFDKTLARSFRREGPNPPTARPTLRASNLPPPSSYEWVWSLGSRADVVGMARWPAGFTSPFVECDVPAAVTLLDVTGNDLAGWQRSGTRLRAWFKTEVKDPSLRWVGRWVAYTPNAAIELPSVAGVTMRVRPTEDVAITVQVARGTQLQPTPRPRETVYVADANSPPPKFVVHPSAATGLRQTESVVRVGNGIEQRVTLELKLAPSRPHSFTLALGHLPTGTETKLEWPTGVTVVEQGNTNARRWLANFAARADETVRVIVLNRFPWKADLVLPSVDVLSANVPLAKDEHRVALGDDLQLATGGRRIAGENAWPIVSDDPIRLIEVAKPPAVLPVAETVELTTPSAPATAFDTRRLLAVGWFVGMLLLAALAGWGSPKLRPEVLMSFGLLAMAVGGWGFAAVAAVGVLLRVMTMTRAVAERVMR